MFFTYRKRRYGLRKNYRHIPNTSFFRNKRRRYKKRSVVNANKTFKNRAARKRPLRNISMTINSFKHRNFTKNSPNSYSYTSNYSYLKYRLATLKKAGAPIDSVNKVQKLYHMYMMTIT